MMNLANVVYHIGKVIDDNNLLSNEELEALQEAIEFIGEITEIHEKMTECIKKGR
jgi:hypothetical protein